MVDSFIITMKELKNMKKDKNLKTRAGSLAEALVNKGTDRHELLQTKVLRGNEPICRLV
jgi:hypothetical protein